VRWKLSHGGGARDGDVTAQGLAAHGVQLCVYDAASSAAPMLALSVPGTKDCNGRSCWRGPAGAAGAIRYRDRSGAAAGVTDLRLSLRGGEMAAMVKARGPQVPASMSPPMELPVVVQLVTGDPRSPRCWQAVLGTPVRNDEVATKLLQP
jgi:hypothetical protein